MGARQRGIERERGKEADTDIEKRKRENDDEDDDDNNNFEGHAHSYIQRIYMFAFGVAELYRRFRAGQVTKTEA